MELRQALRDNPPSYALQCAARDEIARLDARIKELEPDVVRLEKLGVWVSYGHWRICEIDQGNFRNFWIDDLADLRESIDAGKAIAARKGEKV